MEMLVSRRHQGILSRCHPAERHVNLLFDHGAVLSALFHELGMRPSLADAAIFNDDNQVGPGDRT